MSDFMKTKTERNTETIVGAAMWIMSICFAGVVGYFVGGRRKK